MQVQPNERKEKHEQQIRLTDEEHGPISVEGELAARFGESALRGTRYVRIFCFFSARIQLPV
jgi:hypothetical protein